MSTTPATADCLRRAPLVFLLALAAAVLALPVTTSAGASTPGKQPAAKVVRAALAPGKINYIFLILLNNEGYNLTFSPISPARYLNTTLRQSGELLQNYDATGHDSLDNYIAQVSGQ